jgi:hypothetical protein
MIYGQKQKVEFHCPCGALLLVTVGSETEINFDESKAVITDTILNFEHHGEPQEQCMEFKGSIIQEFTDIRRRAMKAIAANARV